MFFGCDSVCGSILIFAGVGFSVISVVVSLANFIKATIDSIPGNLMIVGEEKGIIFNLKIYYASSYFTESPILFFFSYLFFTYLEH